MALRKAAAKVPAPPSYVIVPDGSDSGDIRIPRGRSKKAAGKLPAVLCLIFQTTPTLIMIKAMITIKIIRVSSSTGSIRSAQPGADEELFAQY